MYYSDEIIDQVRSANDIVDVIGQSVPLKRGGSSYVGLCPFHNEKTPSFSVSRQKQMFYCFGCHKGGNVITFMEEYNNMTFTEAMQALADRAGIKLPEREYSEQNRRGRDEKEAFFEVNKIAANYYYFCLRAPSGAPGMEYLHGRMLSDDTIKSFGLGYASKYSDELYKYLKKKKIPDEVLRQSGLMNIDEHRGKMYDKFWNRVMFPIMDVNSRVIGFGGRVMGDGKPKYLNSPQTQIFDKSRNLYALNIARRSREKYIILCEGYMDVISMHQAGFTSAVASLGTALTSQQCSILRRYTENVILSYDSDNAGVNAAMRAVPMLRNAGITPRILKLEPYKDPDEFIKAMGKDAFRERLDHAQNAFMFQIEIIRRDFDLKDPDSKTQFFSQAGAMIAEFPLEIERQNYIDAVAKEYMIEPRQLRELVTMKLMLGGTSASSGSSTYRKEAEAGRGTKGLPDTNGAFDEAYSGNGRPEEDNAWPDDPVSYYGAGQDDEETDFYEDADTGDFYSAPKTVVRRTKEGSVKEQGDDTSRRLLLNYIAKYPSIFGTVKSYVSAKDYGGGLTGRIAELLYAQMERDKRVDEAALSSRFQEPSEQMAVAQMFHTMDPAYSVKDREKSIRETLTKVIRSAPAGSPDVLKAARERADKLKTVRTVRLNIGQEAVLS